MRYSIVSTAPGAEVRKLAVDVQEVKGAEAVVEMVQFCVVRPDGYNPAIQAAAILTSLSSAAIRALGEAQDYIAARSFIGMQLRILGSSDANISKYNMNRLVEFVTLGEFHDDRHFSPMRVSQNGNLIRGGDDI